MQRPTLCLGSIFVVVMLLMTVNTIPASKGDRTERIVDQPGITMSSPSIDSDPWPTFHHDFLRTGVSSLAAPETNAVRWTSWTGDAVESSPAVADGKIFVTCEDYNIYCFDAFSGAILWTYATIDVIVTSPTVADGKVYFGCLDKCIYCLDEDNGALIWKRVTPWVIAQSCPAYYEDKIYIGCHDRRLYCLNADNGSIIWTFYSGEWISSSPAVLEGRVYFGNFLGNVTCLDAETGALIWMYPIGWAIWTSSPTIMDGLLYIGACDRKFYCFDAMNGSLVWSFESGDWFAGTAAVLDGRVYAGSIDNNVYCFDAYTGEVIWSHLADGPVFSSPAIADDKLYVGSDDGNLYCLDLGSGDVIWQYQTGSDIASSPAIAYGNVYVSSMSGQVFCFGNGSQPPIAEYTWTPQAPEPGQTVSFNATESMDPDGVIVLYEWDWNHDGIYDEESATPFATHLWQDPGAYPVTLRVWDNTSDVDTVTHTITIQAADTTPPQVSFVTPKEGYLSIFFRGIPLLRLPFLRTVAVGGFDVTVNALDNESGIDYVEFYLDGELKETVSSEPFAWTWPTRGLHSYNLTVAAYDKAGNSQDASLTLLKIL